MSEHDTPDSVIAALRSRNLLPLLHDICARRGVVVGDVCGRARSKSVTRARQELWWSIRHHPHRSYSLLEIARLFQRDHTTVSHGVAAHDAGACTTSTLAHVDRVVHGTRRGVARPANDAARPENNVQRTPSDFARTLSLQSRDDSGARRRIPAGMTRRHAGLGARRRHGYGSRLHPFPSREPSNLTVSHMAQSGNKSSKRVYTMSVGGQLFRHLGLQMYSGAVPAIAELLSNAYDAMARNVWVEIPTDRPLEPTDTITVRDDGHGMTFEECNGHYLRVGRNRRADGEWTAKYGGLQPRKVQGRKGIGKLAGFGIAERIEVRTIRAGSIAHFALDFNALTKSDQFADVRGYHPEVLEDDDKTTRKKPETVVTLTRLKITRAISADTFTRGIARRLLVLDDNFTVHINGSPIGRAEIPFQFRFPNDEGSWKTEHLENGQSFQWWAGFCKETIPEEEQRGFVVYVRGKLAQAPWFFDLSGGVWGQHGMQYLTGEVRADFLDEAVDLVATDRGSVRWEDPIAAPLKTWGRTQIKRLLESWSNKRREAKQRSPKIAEYLRQAENLPEKERKIFQSVVDRITAIPQIDKDKEGRDIADDLVEFAYNALTNRSFLVAIRRLNAASDEDRAEFEEALSEWDIIEAVNTAHLVKGRVEIIHKFQQMIADKAPEKPDMQEYLKKHPWLIDPKWSTLVHEQGLDRLLREQFSVKSKSKKSGKKKTSQQEDDHEGGRRLDFFCLGDRYQSAHVVEAKRPGALVGREEFDQVRDYVLYLKRKLQDGATNAADRRATIKGLLIADRVREGDDGHAKTYQDAGLFDIRTWENLLIATESMHKEFLDVVKKRAPADDPRMKGLDQVSSGASSTPRRGRQAAKPQRAKRGKRRSSKAAKPQQASATPAAGTLGKKRPPKAAKKAR